MSVSVAKLDIGQIAESPSCSWLVNHYFHKIVINSNILL